MRKFFITLMEEATDGTVSTGMGTSDVSASTTTTSYVDDSTSNTLTEDEALSFLSGGFEQTETQEQIAQQEDVGINLDDIDMSMFGLDEIPEQIPPVMQQQPQTMGNDTLMQQMLERLEALQNPQQQPKQLDNEDIAPLKELAEKMQEAGLLPKGLSEEHEALLQEVKSLRDEIKQQKEQQQQIQEFQTKINNIDAFSNELEQVIPNYNKEFMVNVVTQIANKDARAGEQILNNPSMLISLWNKYGAKAQPRQQSTNVLSSNGNNNNVTSSEELFNRVKSGKGTEADELKLLSSL